MQEEEFEKAETLQEEAAEHASQGIDEQSMSKEDLQKRQLQDVQLQGMYYVFCESAALALWLGCICTHDGVFGNSCGGGYYNWLAPMLLSILLHSAWLQVVQCKNQDDGHDWTGEQVPAVAVKGFGLAFTHPAHQCRCSK